MDRLIKRSGKYADQSIEGFARHQRVGQREYFRHGRAEGRHAGYPSVKNHHRESDADKTSDRNAVHPFTFEHIPAGGSDLAADGKL